MRRAFLRLKVGTDYGKLTHQYYIKLGFVGLVQTLHSLDCLDTVVGKGGFTACLLQLTAVQAIRMLRSFANDRVYSLEYLLVNVIVLRDENPARLWKTSGGGYSKVEFQKAAPEFVRGN